MLLTVSAFGNRRTALSTIAASFLEDGISSNDFTGIGVKPRSPLVTASKKPCRSSRSTAPRLLDLRTSPCGGRRGALPLLRPTLPLLRLIHCKWVVISRHKNDLKIEDTSREAEC